MSGRFRVPVYALVGVAKRERENFSLSGGMCESRFVPTSLAWPWLDGNVGTIARPNVPPSQRPDAPQSLP